VKKPWIEAFEAGKVDVDPMMERINELSKREDETKQKLEDLTPVPDQSSELAEHIHNIIQTWEIATPGEHILEALESSYMQAMFTQENTRVWFAYLNIETLFPVPLSCRQQKRWLEGSAAEVAIPTQTSDLS
jgi:hypothetical protein